MVFRRDRNPRTELCADTTAPTLRTGRLQFTFSRIRTHESVLFIVGIIPARPLVPFSAGQEFPGRRPARDPATPCVRGPRRLRRLRLRVENRPNRGEIFPSAAGSFL